MQEGQISDNGHDEIADAALEEATQEAFPGGKGVLDRNRRTITMENRQYASVLQQMLHSIIEDKDYRQQLNRAVWSSLEEADDWCNAYAECERYGAPVGWLIDRLIAHGAGIQGGLLKMITETISHTTFTTNHLNPKKSMFSFLRNKENDNNKRSPISQ